jgi:hypothetical protein
MRRSSFPSLVLIATGTLVLGGMLTVLGACGSEASEPMCEETQCAPECRPVYYGEDRSGCGVCLCGSLVCSPLECDLGGGLDAGLAVDDGGCAHCGPGGSP